jgi:hypothetical protein
MSTRPKKQPRVKAKGSTESQDVLLQVHELEHGVLASRSNANNIVVLLNLCQVRVVSRVCGPRVVLVVTRLPPSYNRCLQEHASNFRIAVAVMSALRRVLAKLARQGDFSVAPLKQKQPVAASDAATDQYLTWLHDKYQRFVHLLLASLQHTDARLQVAGLHSLMDLVALDCETRAHPEHRLGNHAPNHAAPLPAFSSELFWPVVMRVWAHPGMSDLVPLLFFSRFSPSRFHHAYHLILSSLDARPGQC